MKTARPTVGIPLLLLIFAGFLFFDWRHRSAGVLVDTVAVIFLAMAFAKALIDEASESQRLRNVMQQESHR